MESIREILNDFIPLIEDNLNEEGKRIIREIRNLLDRADFRRNYYRLQLWNLIEELRASNPELDDVISSLLNDIAKKWEHTLTKALNDGKI
ncbi:MAG: hypothetical protein GF329_18140 [Candidatus Lokiarchaeota archaeon]|nr:hypothetical protein [Candidatus Lokiarchaeota archaeon]